MSSRADKLEQLHKSLKKHFKYAEDTTERNVLEWLLYACCLEDARPEQADEAFAKLQQTYFDWNEVRVTTAIELGEVLSHLPNAIAAGNRIKRCLQSVFESRYQYDIDDLKKANLSKATEDLQAWQGVSSFVLNFVSQHALGGHSIPADSATLDVLVAMEILTPSEADKKSIPGAERAIPKNKGLEFGSLLHQFAIEFTSNPKSPTALAVFKDLGITPKAPPEPKPAKKPAPKAEAPVVEAAKAPKAQSKEAVKEAVDKEPAKGATKSDATKPTKVDTKSAGLADVAKKVLKGTDSKSKDPKSKTESAKVDSAKADAAKDASKPATKEPAKTSSKAADKVTKPEDAKVAKPPASKAKEPTTKSKPAAEKSEKPAAKKPAADTKKPTKMANNVKITKKKPK